MRSSSPRRIAILAGGGSLPSEIAASLRGRGAHVHVIAIKGAADIQPGPGPQTTVDFAQIGKILGILKADELTEMLIIGSVSRPDLGAIRPDLGFFLALPTIIRLIRAGGDDAVLRGVIEFFERRGVTIVGPADVAPELIVSSGPLGCHSAGPQQKADIAKGLSIIRSLARFDVGQAVVVAQGRVEAIEGAEGTDRMLQRVADMRARGTDSGGVLAKSPKPGQEMRIDVPTIGPQTVRRVREAGLSGIAVTSDCVLAAEREALRKYADAADIYIEGVPADQMAGQTGTTVWPISLQPVGRHRPSARQRSDCIKGGGVMTALAHHDVAARLAIVHRSHVLTVETGEGLEKALKRAGDLRQWGRRVWMRSAGVAVLADDGHLNAILLASAAETGLAGIAVMLGNSPPDIERAVIEDADRRGLFIAGLTRGEGLPG